MTIIFHLINDLAKLLIRKDKLKLFFLFLLIIINVFVEMIGIGVIFPLLGFLISEKFTNEYIQYLYFLNNFFVLNNKNLVIFFSVILIIIFLIKNLFFFFFSFLKY